MHRATRFFWLFGALLATAQWPAPGSTAPVRAPAEPVRITPQEIEADWLRQEVVREDARRLAGFSGSVKPDDDAAGGCDGVIDGKWGFHTADEENPWWQVDLGQPLALDRVVLYNRCDACGPRNDRIQVLLSDDGRTFRLLYQHAGPTFWGYSDGKPLVVPLQGATGRYLRLQLPGKSYFHLDEVQVYPAGSRENAALGKPATQSSVSPWSAVHPPRGAQHQPLPAARVIQSGLALAASLRRLGAPAEAGERLLRALASRVNGNTTELPPDLQRQLYLQARWTVRRMAFSNPLLDFDSILFVKSAPGRFPHISDQYYGWWSRPGGGVYVLEGFRGPAPRLRCLTAALPEGSFLRPDLSYDGKRVLFSYCRYYPHVPDIADKFTKANLPEDAFYHVYEVKLDGTGLRRLTRGRYDDVDARYLPNGDIVFLSTRKGRFIQCTAENTRQTAYADLPDSYVRCGGDNYRPVPVFTLHAMDANGGNLRPLSAFETFEYTPSVASDGQILYTRWDYIDRFNGHFFSLWSTRPDGTNPQLVYGNYTVRPQAVLEARPIPNSSKLVCTASAHHSITGGSLVLLDRSKGTEGPAPITRLTPEVPFPETEANVGCYYANPYPLSEEHFLVAWSDRALPPHSRVDDTVQNPVNATGIYLYDAFGNLNLIYRDPKIASGCPIPVRPRPRPPVHPDTVDWAGPQEGRFVLQDVYQGLTGVPRGSVKWLRVIGVPPKTQPHMNTPCIGVSQEDPGRFLLGTVPVEPDGSASFRVPSGIPVYFQAIDARGLAIQTMRSLTYVWPKQTLSCVGCHEPREASPVTRKQNLIALGRAPSKLTPGPPGSWPLRFDELVQPILNRSCVSCHQPGGASSLDLTPSRAYESLLTFGDRDLHRLAFERDRSNPGECPAANSKLWALLTAPGGHHGVSLDPESLGRIALWMDLYAQRTGHFSPEQEAELRDLRRRLAPLLADAPPALAAAGAHSSKRTGHTPESRQ